jgi:hypothetical protein
MAFMEMAEQLQKAVVSPRQRQQAATVAQLDPQKYVATMQQLMQNPSSWPWLSSWAAC